MAKVADMYVEMTAKDGGLSMTLKNAISKLGEMKLLTLGEIGSLGVLGDFLKDAGFQAMGMASSYTTLNKELGISSDMLQKWQNVARASNVPIQAVANSFSNIQKTLTGFKQGVVNDQFLRGASFLGLGREAPSLTYDQLFEALRSKVPQLLRSRGAAFTSQALSMLGIDPAMIQMLSLSQSQFRTRGTNNPIISAQQVQEWTELNNQVAVLRQRFFMWGETILTAALPGLIKFAELIASLDRGLEGFIKKNYGIAAEAASAPHLEGPGFLPNFQHALISFLDPKWVMAHDAKSMVINNNPRTDIHIQGDNPYAIGQQVKDYVRQAHQENMTYTLQALQTPVAS